MPQINRLNLPSGSAKQQALNRATWNDARSIEGADFFTFGYTGRKTDELIKSLKAAGVQTVIDIRQNPVSMYRPELSKANLTKLLETNGISYQHQPELGVPRDIRARAIETGTRDVIWDWYDEWVVQPYLRANLHAFLNGADHPVALMCVETDPTECHRHRLFVALEELGLRGYDL